MTQSMHEMAQWGRQFNEHLWSGGDIKIRKPEPTPEPKLSAAWKVALAVVSFYSHFGMVCVHFLAFELAVMLYLGADGIPPFILLVWAYTCGSHFSYLFHAVIAALPVFETEEEKGQICGKGLGFYFMKSHRTPFQAVAFAEHKIADVTGRRLPQPVADRPLVDALLANGALPWSPEQVP